MDFYGWIDEIIILQYKSNYSATVFKETWFYTNKGICTDKLLGIIDVDYTSRFSPEDPFILAS